MIEYLLDSDVLIWQLRDQEDTDVTPAIANLAGTFIRDYRAKGITLDFVDSVVAATAVIHGLTLLTHNIKHYPMPEVNLYSP